MLGYARLVSMLPLKGCSIYQVYTHPQKLAVGIYQFWGLQLVAHGGLPGGGHRGYKGKFGHVGVPPEV